MCYRALGTGGRCYTCAEQTPRVHSPGGNTFLTSWPPYWRCDVKSKFRLCQSMRIYLKNNPAKLIPIRFAARWCMLTELCRHLRLACAAGLWLNYFQVLFRKYCYFLSILELTAMFAGFCIFMPQNAESDRRQWSI